MKDIPTLPTLLADTAGYFTYVTASKTVVKQKKKLNYSKIINHPKDVFPLKWIGEIQEI